MRLTRHTDYALRVLMYLARKGEGLSTIKEIAGRYSISENHLMKVVHQLGRNGYITTVRGRQGGMRLAAAPDQINIGAVVRYMSGDVPVAECFAKDGDECAAFAQCGLRGPLHDAQQAFFGVLDGYCLAQVIKDRRLMAGILAK